MIRPTTIPLKLTTGCHHAACRFDIQRFDEDQWQGLGIALPARLATAVTKRKAEFLAGRYCAHIALQEMGWREPPEIDIGADRAPAWPPGVVGSITHSKGFAAAALATEDTLRGIGIDSEALIAEKTARNVYSHILVPSERFEDNRAQVDSQRQYLTLVFSAKESIFKCLHPQVKQYFDFRDAEVSLDPGAPGRFYYRLLKDLNDEFRRGYSGAGEFVIEGDFVHTAVLLGGATAP
ncbi:4'-phosphopantetheinyl transferase family protein [Gilvimarinus sp. F26214L]|uniref:4'-phosphopantetheinyl transferase family protein n=1 Tax=Gilvimarinus sp. DZF01 TaxID=3461371 RepID=UPI0040454343